MELHELNTMQVAHWYKSQFEITFIEQERKPLALMLELIERGEYQVLGVFKKEGYKELFDQQSMVGYVAIAKKDNINLLLLDYLGVTEINRNKGYGGKILVLLQNYYKDIPIVLESELPIDGATVEENSIRNRRINFYKRNGFIPVYEMATCGLRWQALIGGYNGVLKKEDIDEIIKNHRLLYGDDRDDVVIPLGEKEVPPKSNWVNS